MKSHRFQASALAVACATALVSCGGDGSAPSPQNTGIFPEAHHARVFEYPADGVDLGQGWHREGVSKAVATCIQFRALEDTGQEQSMELSVITDSSALMDKLDISAEAQFKSISFKVSGKARFAQDTELRTSSVNALAHARVMNGVEYVAPAEGGSQQGRIDLTPHYRDLARRNRLAFEQECGDGFVAAIHSGAELTAMLSFTESDSSKRRTIEASMSGSGWGFSAKGSASSVMEQHATAGTLRVTFHQTGGSGSPIPTTQAGFVSAIERLPELAAKDAYNYQIQVLDYSALPGYPRGSPEADEGFHAKVASSYGRLETLRVGVVEALQASEKSPSRYSDIHRDQSLAAFRTRMRILHDDLLARLRALRRFAADCAFYDKDMGPRESCTLRDDLDLRNDYAYRLRLPVPMEAASDPVNTANAVVDQHVRDVSRRRCERDLEDPGCLAESEVEKLREGAVNSVSSRK